jgi:hypothetical protein
MDDDQTVMVVPRPVAPSTAKNDDRLVLAMHSYTLLRQVRSPIH